MMLTKAAPVQTKQWKNMGELWWVSNYPAWGSMLWVRLSPARAPSAQARGSRAGGKASPPASALQRPACSAQCPAPACPGGLFCQLWVTSRCFGSLPRILRVHWLQKGRCMYYTSPVPSLNRKGILYKCFLAKIFQHCYGAVRRSPLKAQ